MTPGAIRTVLRVVAAAGIPGIIAGSIAQNDAVVIVFGSMTAVAAFGLILVTAVTTSASVDTSGLALESRIGRLVAAGADEDEVRSLVAEAVDFGQHRQNS